LTLQRHTGSHAALPPVADVPLSPDAAQTARKKKPQPKKPSHLEPCEGEGGS